MEYGVLFCNFFIFEDIVLLYIVNIEVRIVKLGGRSY